MTNLPKNSPLQELMQHFAQSGTLEWIGLRPGPRKPLVEVPEVFARIGTGLDGDRYKGTPESKRQVSLIQAEYLEAVGSYMGREPISPLLTRRNLVVRGINLLALKDKCFTIGEAILEFSGECHPCSRMEQNLGEGGYNAMRQHGGILVRVIQEGLIKVGDRVEVVA